MPMRDLEEVIDAVRQANRKFYQAFEALSIEEMEQIWAAEDHAKCVHPNWDVVIGWNAIRQSWLDIFRGTDYMKFALEHLQIDVYGNIATVVLVENLLSSVEGRVSESSILATNIYELRGNEWLLILHHASPAPVEVTQSFNGTLQ